MNETVTIFNKQIIAKEYEGQRVVTAWDIATLHGVDVHSIKMNFKNNIKQLKENKDYFLIPKQSEFARNIIASGEATVQAINASKNIVAFTESGYLMIVKPMQDDLSWQVQKQLVKSYFKVQEIKNNFINNDSNNFNGKIESLKLEQQGLKFTLDILKPSKVSTVKMLKEFNTSQGLSTVYFPNYVDEQEGHSATELLKKYDVSLTTIKFNKLMLQYGYLEECTRKSTNKKGFKHYKKLTEKGLNYGKNVISSRGTEKETQPLYYENTFKELTGKIFN